MNYDLLACPDKLAVGFCATCHFFGEKRHLGDKGVVGLGLMFPFDDAFGLIPALSQEPEYLTKASRRGSHRMPKLRVRQTTSDLMTIAQVQHELQCCRSTVYGLLKAKKLAAVKVIGATRIKRLSVTRYIENNSLEGRYGT